MPETTTARDKRIGELLDKQAIREVTDLYCRAIDRCDASLLATAYHFDAVHDHGGRTFTGEEVGDGLVSWMRETTKTTSHHITSQSVRVFGNTAGGESYYIAVYETTGDDRPTRVLTSGRFIDRFLRRDDRWRIIERLVVVDLRGTLTIESDHDVGPALARRGYEDPSYAVLPMSNAEPVSGLRWGACAAAIANG